MGLGALGLGLVHAGSARADIYKVCGYDTVTAGGEASTCMSLPDAVTAAIATNGSDTIEMYPGQYCPLDIEGNVYSGISFVGMGVGGLNQSEGGISVSGSEAEMTVFRWSAAFCGGEPNVPAALVTVNGYIQGGSFSFRNVTFDGSPTDGPNDGVLSPGREPMDLTLRDVLVENFRGTGVSYTSDSSSSFVDQSMEMTDSAVIGNGIGVTVWGYGSIGATTVYGNSTGVFPHGDVSLLNDTIVNNEYGVDPACCGNQLQVVNTLVAGNTTADCKEDYDWEAGSLGSESNILDDPSCTSTKPGADTLLPDKLTTIRAPDLNGGPTPSILPIPQARGSGTPNLCSPDQREFVSSGSCDVGSVQEGASGTPTLAGATVDFGQIDAGVEATRSASFSIGGGGQVDVTGVTLAGAGYTMVSDGCSNAVLVPGSFGALSSCSMTVSLNPATVGEWDGTITVDTTAGSQTIQLTADAVVRPVGIDDSYDVDAGTIDVAAPGVLGNDPAATSVDQVVQQPSDGTLTGPNADGSFSYRSDLGFTGSDSFEYAIVDAGGVVSNPITVRLHVVTPRTGPKLYVNAEWAGTGTGDDPDGAGPATSFGTDAFATITDALAKASTASVVHVEAGTYAETPPAIQLAGLQILGDDSDTTHLKLGGALQVDAPGVTISGLDIQGPGSWDTATKVFTGPGTPALWFTSGAGSTVSDCVIEDAFVAVSMSGEGGEGGGLSGDEISITGNEIVHTVFGIELEDATSSTIERNTIHDTGSSSTTYRHAAISVEGGDHDTVDLNTITDSGDVGIDVETADSAIENNTVESSGTSYPQFAESSGIVVDGANQDVYDNTISGNTITGSAFAGIEVRDAVSGTTISGNTISGTLHGGADGDPASAGASAGGAGILIAGAQGSVDTTAISTNTITGNAGWGILQAASGGNASGTTANENDIVGNALGGVDNRDSSLLDATQNWWGDASGPAGLGTGSGQAVAADVDPADITFDPWRPCPIAQGDCSGPPANEPPTASFTSSASGLRVSFDASASSDADGNVVGYAWTFGDAATGTGVAPSHTYATAGTYTVTLTVTDDGGSTGTKTSTVTVTAASPPANVPPTASFTWSASGLTASVDGFASSDADGSVASYAWAFGDGVSATGATASHTYATGGTYTVMLTVTDDRGATGTFQSTVTLATPPPPATTIPVQQPPAPPKEVDIPPSAHAAVAPGTGNKRTSFAFSASGSIGKLVGYSWDFGDGTTATSVDATHMYGRAGTFTATLTVTDGSGRTSVDHASVVVRNAPPVPAFTYHARAGRSVSFDGSGSRDPDGRVSAYRWSFGDGARATGRQVTHRYRGTKARYSVSLEVVDDSGTHVHLRRSVSVHAGAGDVSDVESIAVTDSPRGTLPSIVNVIEPVSVGDVPDLIPPAGITDIENIGAVDGTAPVHHP